MAQIALLELVAAVSGERVDAGHGQQRADAEGHGGRVPHFDAGGVDARSGRPWPPNSAGEARPFQPACGPGPVGLLPAGRHGDGAVLEVGAVAVADDVERRDHVAGEAAGLLEHGVDDVLVQIAEQPLAHRRGKSSAVIERGFDVAHRRPIGHDVISGLPKPGPVPKGLERAYGAGLLPANVAPVVGGSIQRDDAATGVNRPRSALEERESDCGRAESRDAFPCRHEPALLGRACAAIWSRPAAKAVGWGVAKW